MIEKMRAWATLALIVLVAALGACAPDIPEDEDVERTQVVFEPEEQRIPLPSDLALEEDGTLPMPQGAEEGTAQEEFNQYVDQLHGWLPATEITIPVDGPIDEESLDDDDVVILELDDEEGPSRVEVEQVRFDEDNMQIVAEPSEPLSFATDYGYVLLQDVDDAQGEPLIASQAIWFGLSEEPLVDEEGEPTVGALEGMPEQAAELEELRQFLSPVADAAVEAGIERDEIIAASRWHTANDAFAVFEPDTGEIPFPNEVLRDQEAEPGEGAVNLPMPEEANQLTTSIIEELNRRDGFSSTADSWVPTAGTPLDPETVTESNIPLVWAAEDDEGIYTDGYGVEYREDFEIISVFPEETPFRQGVLNAGIVTSGVEDAQGRSIKPTPAFVFVRSEHPLVDEEGESTVEQLGDDDAQQLEQVRQAYQQLLAGFGPLAPDREDIAVAWTFATDVATFQQRALNAVAEVFANQGGSPSAQGDPADFGAEPEDPELELQLAEAQRSAFYETQIFVDPEAEGDLADEPEPAEVPISIAIPDEDNPETDCSPPYQPVIVAHGIGGEREGMLQLFGDTLASPGVCMATITLDLWLHGERTQGEDSGDGFLSGDAVATKNNFMQSVVDLTILVDVIQDDGLEGVLDDDDQTDLIDEEEIGFVGVSLGGLIGTNFLATEPDVDTGVLHVAGAKLTEIFLEGAFRDELLPQLPAELEPESFEFYQTINFIQWVVEPAEPWKFAPHLQDDPLALLTFDADTGEFSPSGEAGGPNEVLVQMAGNDQVIPNSTTERLAEAAGVSLDDTTFPDVEHGFIGTPPDDEDADETTIAAASCARQQIAEWLATGLSDGATLVETTNACGLAADSD